MSKKAVKYMLVVLGIFIFLAGYFMVYLDFTEKTENLDIQIREQSERLSELEGHNAALPEYEAAIAEDRAAIGETLSRYYSDETPEDFIMLAIALENTVGMTPTTLSFTEPAPIHVIAGLEEGEDVTAPVELRELTAYQISSEITGAMSYQQMKTALDHIYSQRDKTTIEALSLNFDSSTGLLASTLRLNKYFITGRDIPDHQVVIPPMDMGKSDLMGG